MVARGRVEERGRRGCGEMEVVEKGRVKRRWRGKGLRRGRGRIMEQLGKGELERVGKGSWRGCAGEG